jgi:hypothetical protein
LNDAVVALLRAAVRFGFDHLDGGETEHYLERWQRNYERSLLPWPALFR